MKIASLKTYSQSKRCVRVSISETLGAWRRRIGSALGWRATILNSIRLLPKKVHEPARAKDEATTDKENAKYLADHEDIVIGVRVCFPGTRTIVNVAGSISYQSKQSWNISMISSELSCACFLQTVALQDHGYIYISFIRPRWTWWEIAVLTVYFNTVCFQHFLQFNPHSRQSRRHRQRLYP